MFWIYLILIISIACFTIVCGASIGWNPSLSQFEIELDNLPEPIDVFRSYAKDKGLVLHIPSYRNGVEAYCPPNAEYNKIPDSWLVRF
jgi:hypothetical protein